MGEKILASIDMGTHTARLLVARVVGGPGVFRPLSRKRAYIRLAEDLEKGPAGTIKGEAMDRALSALEDFTAAAGEYGVETIHAVTTGVMRMALNRDLLLDLIYERTGIRVEVISGDREARLTAKGVLYFLDIGESPFLVFDLGGGTTEFVFGEKGDLGVISLSLGAATLTQRFLRQDPPDETDLKALASFVDDTLQGAFQGNLLRGHNPLVVGTGGTVTTLAAMMHHVGTADISPERMNGLRLAGDGIECLFSGIKDLPLSERLHRVGLDRGRAEVILAGTVAVMRILHFLKCPEMVVCLSDLLEGVLIEHLEGTEGASR
jgi:exopolyphosphatase/guanosine-5'-triphosphate,3'-diphosphate pyrophosphatase